MMLYEKLIVHMYIFEKIYNLLTPKKGVITKQISNVTLFYETKIITDVFYMPFCLFNFKGVQNILFCQHTVLIFF